MDRARLTRWLLGAAILYVTGFYFIGSAIKPGYSQLSNFVSEYNASGTAWSGLLTYAGYLATTAILCAFLFAATPILEVSGASRIGLWMAWSIPASFLISVIAPCDQGCPLDGTQSQQLHNLLAVVTYIGMGASLALLSTAPHFSKFGGRRAFILGAGIAFPAVFVVMVQPELAPWRGLLQRLLDIALAVSLVLVVKTLGVANKTGQDAVGR